MTIIGDTADVQLTPNFTMAISAIDDLSSVELPHQSHLLRGYTADKTIDRIISACNLKTSVEHQLKRLDRPNPSLTSDVPVAGARWSRWNRFHSFVFDILSLQLLL